MEKIIKALEKEGLKCKLNYDDGKKIEIYYAKSDFISISLDKCIEEQDIESTVLKNKEKIKNLIGLCKILKIEKKKIKDNLSQLLKKYFGIEIEFSISILKNEIIIQCFDYQNIFNLHNIEDFSNILFFLKNTDSPKSFYKVMEKTLPNYIISNYFEKIKQVYFSMLKNKDLYSIIEKTNEELLELSGNLNKVGIIFICQSKTMETMNKYDLSNLDSYNLIPSKNGLIISLDDIDMFKINDEVSILYDKDEINYIYNTCSFLNRMYYDFAEIFRRKHLNTNNLSIIITETNKIYIGTYSNIFEVKDFNSSYNFLLDECDKIKNSIFTGNEREYSIEILNNLNILRHCMQIYGEISLEEYISHSKRFNISLEDALESYYSLPKTLEKLIDINKIEEYAFIGKDKYKIKFKNTSTCVDCIENRQLLFSNLPEIIDFNEMIGTIPERYLFDIFDDKDLVKKNSLNFIQAFDNHHYCCMYRELFSSILPYLDKKYIPLLSFKLKKIDAKKKLGKLYTDIEHFLNEEEKNGY